MKEQNLPEHVFNYALAEVVFIFFNRYPNSFAKHVIHEDVLSRHITDNEIVTKKLLVKEGSDFLKKVPRWMSRLTKVQFMPTLEESVFDRRTGRLHTYTRNVSWTRTMYMTEECFYRKLNEGRTAVDRKLSVQAYCSIFSGTVEKLLMNVFRKSTHKTLEGFNEKLLERFGQRSSDGQQPQDSTSPSSTATGSWTVPTTPTGRRLSS